MQVHMDNLALLRKPLDELQREIPSMADLDDESETNIAEVSNNNDKSCMLLLATMAPPGT